MIEKTKDGTDPVEVLLKESVRQLTPYQVSPETPRIKLDANENNWLAGRFQPALKELLDTLPLHQYPDTDCLALRHKLALMNQVVPGQVITGVGSDQIIAWIVQAFVEKGDRVQMMDPTFAMYEINAQMAGAEPVKVPLGEGFTFQPDRFLEAAKISIPKVVFLTNPNNPTGGAISADDMAYMVEELSRIPCIIAVDEAYYEFHGETMAPFLNRHPRMIVLRTLSKAYGLAGVRAGYALGSEHMINALARVKPPYHMSSLDQLAALVCLEQAEEVKPLLDSVIHWREHIRECLLEMDTREPLEVFPSQANFLLARTPAASDLMQALKQEGIFVRGYGSEGPLADCLRVTIGTEKENRQLLDVVRNVLAKK